MLAANADVNASNSSDQETARLSALFRRVTHGDERAFRELYDEVSRPLLAYCLSYTRNMDDARDLFQQTMVAVYEHRHAYRDQNLKGWIFTIARNACRTWEQKSKRFTPLTEDHILDVHAETPEDQESVALVQAAILELPEEFRTAILLRHFGEMSIRDIAESEEISESLVKIRLFRARERLSIALGPLIGPES